MRPRPILLREIDPYDSLPAGVRLAVDRKQWSFLTDDQRARLVREFTEPDTYDD
jgi:hypothetical protein